MISFGELPGSFSRQQFALWMQGPPLRRIAVRKDSVRGDAAVIGDMNQSTVHGQQATGSTNAVHELVEAEPPDEILISVPQAGAKNLVCSRSVSLNPNKSDSTTPVCPAPQQVPPGPNAQPLGLNLLTCKSDNGTPVSLKRTGPFREGSHPIGARHLRSRETAGFEQCPEHLQLVRMEVIRNRGFIEVGPAIY